MIYTEKVFTDDWAKKLPTNNHRKEPINTVQQQGLLTHYLYLINFSKNFFLENNNTLQFRPAIPRRSSIGKIPASHNLLVTSQIHNHHEQKFSARHFDSDIDRDEGIDSAIDHSHSLSINTPEENVNTIQKNCVNKISLFRIIINNRKNLFDQYIVVQQDVKLIVYLITEVI